MHARVMTSSGAKNIDDGLVFLVAARLGRVPPNVSTILGAHLAHTSGSGSAIRGDGHPPLLPASATERPLRGSPGQTNGAQINAVTASVLW